MLQSVAPTRSEAASTTAALPLPHLALVVLSRHDCCQAGIQAGIPWQASLLGLGWLTWLLIC